LGKDGSNRSLRLLESGLLTTGIVLLAAFFLLRGLGNYQGQSDISVFEQAMASESAAEMPLAGGNIAQSVEPDYSLWSEKRINDYHASHTQRDDAPLAILSIDKLDLKVPVYNGTDEINLNRGAGRIKGTARVGSPGNLGIAAHRDGFFRALKDIEIGDSINMLTHRGKTEFVVSSITIVDPTDVSVLAPTDEPSITLVTCYPFYFVGHAPKRYIVKGELLSNQVNKS
jgi:sortase A